MLKRYVIFPLLVCLMTLFLPSHLVAVEGDTPAARLDGVVITQTQIDNILAKPNSATQIEKQTALERIITQELMARQAMRERLDKGSSVVAAIEAAKRQILAQAYLAERARDIAKPTSTMIQDYYDEHPALFAKRAIYELQEINIQVDSIRLAAVIDHYNQIKTLNDMIDWLKINNIPHTSNAAVRSAEDLPGDLLGPVSRLQPGQVIKVNTDTGVAIVQLTDKRTESITLSEAQPNIEAALINQTLGERVGQEVSRLRSEVTIEYYPPYKPLN